MTERLTNKNIPALQETRDKRYVRLRAEVQQWINREQEKKRAWIEGGRKDEEIGYDPHTDRINPIYLTEADLDFWDKMQNQENRQTSITTDWEQYNTEFVVSMDSRRNFFAAMGNAVAVREITAIEARNKISRRKKKQ